MILTMSPFVASGPSAHNLAYSNHYLEPSDPLLGMRAGAGAVLLFCALCCLFQDIVGSRILTSAVLVEFPLHSAGSVLGVELTGPRRLLANHAVRTTFPVVSRPSSAR